MDLDLNSTLTLDLDFGLGLTRTWTWIVTIDLMVREEFVERKVKVRPRIKASLAQCERTGLYSLDEELIGGAENVKQ